MTAGVMLDTDVLSFLLKGDTRADLYRPHILGRLTAISFMTLAEIEVWPIRRNWGEARRQRLYSALDQYVLLPTDRALCRLWAEVMESARRSGRPIQTADAWIAAAAQRYDIPLLTHNPADYQGVEKLAVVSEAGA